VNCTSQILCLAQTRGREAGLAAAPAQKEYWLSTEGS
jgi:hypothetical protein